MLTESNFAHPNLDQRKEKLDYDKLASETKFGFGTPSVRKNTNLRPKVWPV
jgi:hypothetical protein